MTDSGSTPCLSLRWSSESVAGQVRDNCIEHVYAGSTGTIREISRSSSSSSRSSSGSGSIVVVVVVVVVVVEVVKSRA